MAAGSKPKEFSVDFKRDPTRSDRIIVPYEESVLKALEEFKAWLIKTVEKAAGPDEVHTQAVQDIVLATLLKQIDQRVAAKVLDPIYQDAAKYVEQSYSQGDAFASVVMSLEPSENIRRRESTTITTLLTEQETYLKGMTDDMVKSVKGVITDGMLNNVGMYDITKDLAAKVDISMSRASTIVRTETMTALAKGAMDRYKKEGVERFRWVTTYDERECDECAQYGMPGDDIYTAEQLPPWPAHPNCRCAVLSVYTQEETAEEPSEEGSEETYAPEQEPQKYTVDERMDEFTTEYKDAQIEYAQIYSNDGTIVSTIAGKGDEVTLPEGISNTTVIHNHPMHKTAVSLSPEDLITAQRNNLSELTAVGKSGDRMTITRPSTGWKKISMNKYDSTRSSIISEMKTERVFNEYTSKIRNGELTPDEASEIANNEIVQRTFKALGQEVKYVK